MKRLVVKIGTKVLSQADGALDVGFLRHVVDQIVDIKKQGIQVVLVTSGAVGAGKSLVSLNGDRSDVVQKQVFAAVGQVKLMTVYAELFAVHAFHCAQVLATKEDFRDENHYLNMQNCFEGLLIDGVVPIVNENDVVATTELLFTDNDELAGLVAKQLKADALIILTGTDGILDKDSKTVSEVTPANRELVASYITPDTSRSGRGGMTSKFQAASLLSEAGTAVHIVGGRKENVILDAVAGKRCGTTFIPQIS